MTTTLRRWLTDFWAAEDGSRPVKDVFAWAKDRLLGPRSRLLRTLVIVSLAIQLSLAPLTSWSLDTPSFVSSVVALVYRGSPYATNQLFNPPLGAFLEAPFFAILSIWIPPQNLIVNVVGITPAAGIAGVSTFIPSPAALLALKLPLILAMVGAGLCVYYLAERTVGAQKANWVAGSWLLNPLVIWATSVHGEVDALACIAVLAFLVAILQRWYFSAGVALALGVLSKAYPIVILPMAIVAVNLRNGPPNECAPSACIARFATGLGLAILPFLTYLPNLESIDGGLSGLSSYGGFNPLLLFNPGVFLDGPKVGWGFFSAGNAAALYGVFVGLFIVAMAGSLILAYMATYAPGTASISFPSTTLAFAVVWPVAAVLLFQSSPQSENLLLLLAVVLVLGCVSGLLVRILYWVITGAGLLLYFALASPAAYFYPLAALGGPSWVSSVNSVVIAYRTNTIVPYQDFWVIAGLVGATSILILCALAIRHLVGVMARAVLPKPTTSQGLHD